MSDAAPQPKSSARQPLMLGIGAVLALACGCLAVVLAANARNWLGLGSNPRPAVTFTPTLPPPISTARPSATALPTSASATEPAASDTPIPASATPLPTSTAAAPIAFDPGDYTLERVVSGLDQPVLVTHAGDERLFIVEQPGTIRVFENGALLPEPFLDISERVNDRANEQGLLGLAFHPDYAANGVFFLNYTGADGQTVIARYRVTDDPNRADPNSETIILQIEQPYANHNGGNLIFGPDGYLYIGMGDGGAAGDPENRAQNLRELLGKMLRIDVNADRYAIPADNPFVGRSDALPEIWSYGVRNPWRFSFDRATGDMYMADVGQNEYEEVNFQPASSRGGENYGWRFLEGTHPYEGRPPADVVMPVAEYSHGEGGCSVTGGFVYRGATLPALNGVYFFGDYCSGLIWSLHRDPAGAWQRALFAETGMTLSSFGEDLAGELYVLDHRDGVVYRLAARN